MKRSIGISVSPQEDEWAGRAEVPKCDAFIADLKELCKKHDVILQSEDGHAAFIVQNGFNWEETWVDHARFVCSPKEAETLLLGWEKSNWP